MFKFLDALADELEKRDLFTFITVDNVRAGNAITLMSMPSGRGDSYYKGNRTKNGLFQLMVKHQNQQAAMLMIEVMDETIDQAEIEVEGYKIIKLETYTEPHYLQGDSQEGWLYNAAYAVEFTKE
jgi:hypothetical protein